VRIRFTVPHERGPFDGELYNRPPIGVVEGFLGSRCSPSTKCFEQHGDQWLETSTTEVSAPEVVSIH